jgi:preprotein translocase subunit SecF
VFDKGVDRNDLNNFLENDFPDIRIRVISDSDGNQRGFFIETKVAPAEITEKVEEYLGYQLNQENSSVEFSGSTLSQGFYQQLRFAIVIAFVFMAVVVFFVFRTIVPSLAVILSAFADIVMTVALVNFLGMEMSTAGIIAFLMLIGYSVDTDILLTTRLLKERQGSVNRAMFDAFKTGITMTLTSIVAVGVSLFIIYNLSDALRQIFSILVIGLGFDLINTWFANASILKWYVEKKEGTK